MNIENKLVGVQKIAEEILDEMSKIIIGKAELTNYLLISLFSEGNVLLEGVPGIAKTTISKTFAYTLGCDYKRIQFTPDIMPADITGTYVYTQKTGEFELRKGPVFANIILADEINRASPKSQSALLECMEEKQVTLEGVSMKLPEPFMIIANQNPIELEGTYPLPEAQIDRFLFKLAVGYPDEKEELDLLIRKDKEVFKVLSELKKVATPEQIMDIIATVKNVHTDEKVMRYIRNLVAKTRNNKDILLGASPRASIGLLRASKSFAAIQGRFYVIPDDVKYLFSPVINHRLILTPESEFSGLTAGEIIHDILNDVEVL